MNHFCRIYHLLPFTIYLRLMDLSVRLRIHYDGLSFTEKNPTRYCSIYRQTKTGFGSISLCFCGSRGCHFMPSYVFKQFLCFDVFYAVFRSQGFKEFLCHPWRNLVSLKHLSLSKTSLNDLESGVSSHVHSKTGCCIVGLGIYSTQISSRKQIQKA